MDNGYNQEVFEWCKSMADTLLEGCVKDVEDLAWERREVQDRLMELTRLDKKRHGKQREGVEDISGYVHTTAVCYDTESREDDRAYVNRQIK
ncbi:hypothetical protein BGX34_003744, partial [Mortierella sp. NVP85]